MLSKLTDASGLNHVVFNERRASVERALMRRTKTRSSLLRDRVKQSASRSFPSCRPLSAGAVGYAGYDTVRYVENCQTRLQDDRESAGSVVRLLRSHGRVRQRAEDCDRRRAGERLGQRGIEPSETARSSPERPRCSHARRYDDACRRVDRLVEKLSTPTDTLTPTDIDVGGDAELDYQSNFTQPEFEDAVRKCVEYIRAGDIFQVVISQRLAVPLAVDPFEVYRTLRVVNPSPFMFFPADAEVHARGQLAGDHGPRRGWQSDGPAAGRHAPPRQDGGRRRSGSPRSCWPTPRSGPST